MRKNSSLQTLALALADWLGIFGVLLRESTPPLAEDGRCAKSQAPLLHPWRRFTSATEWVTSCLSTDWSRSASCLKYTQTLPILCLPSLDSKDLCPLLQPTRRPPVPGHGWQSLPRGFAGSPTLVGVPVGAIADDAGSPHSRRLPGDFLEQGHRRLQSVRCCAWLLRRCSPRRWRRWAWSCFRPSRWCAVAGLSEPNEIRDQ